VSTAYGICHTVMDRVKFTDKMCVKIKNSMFKSSCTCHLKHVSNNRLEIVRLKLQLLLIMYFCWKCNMFYWIINNVHTRYCYLPLSWKSWNWFDCAVVGVLFIGVWQIPDAVDTVVCAPDDWWWYHQKHVEQFPDKINCITLHLVGYILEYSYGARIHELWKAL
jgi:hypothetical protein